MLPVEAVVKMQIIPLNKEHYHEVSKIYKEGLDSGIATFESTVPTWEQWDKKFLEVCRFVVVVDTEVVAWCTLSAVSIREVYNGVAESTIYVGVPYQGKGIAKILLNHLISESENEGFWTLQVSIFSENKASIQLHENCGFRNIGIREKIAKRDGRWHDNIIMEKRSSKI